MSSSQHLFHMLAQAQHRLVKRADACCKDQLDVTTTQLGVLFVLEKRPGALLKTVSEALGINASAITALISRMEDAGLVRREPSEQDARAVHLHATRDGLAKAAAARPVLARLNAQLTEGFSEREVATVIRFVASIIERF